MVNSVCYVEYTICNLFSCDHVENECAVLQACCNGKLQNQALQWRQNAYAVGVVMASRGYPESSSKGNVITGEMKCLANHGQSVWDLW